MSAFDSVREDAEPVVVVTMRLPAGRAEALAKALMEGLEWDEWAAKDDLCGLYEALTTPKDAE